MRRKTMLLSAAALIALIAAGSAAAVGFGSTLAIESDPRQEPLLIQVATAKPGVGAMRAFTGIVSARVQSNLGFRVGGKVTERLVDVGQTVRTGDPLMRIDPTDLELARTAKVKAVAAARATAEQAAADEMRYRNL